MTHTRQNFRCTAGCCICGTKSSTSRFTSSNNYEAYFENCFLVLDRSGDICNACVLIVKRFMKNPHSGHNWHHIVDNGHNKKNRKKVSLKIRLLTNTTGKNFDASNPPPAVVTAKDDAAKNNKYVKYRHRTRQQRAAERSSESEWVHLSNPEVPNVFFRDHDPYPRLSTQHLTTSKSSSQSSRQHILEEHHEQHIFQNPTEQPCLSKPYKQLQESREQTYLHQSSKQLPLPTPPRYPSPVGHHCYPTPATTPDLNTSSSSSSYPSTRNCAERCTSLSPFPPASCNCVDDASPYEEADGSYMSSLSHSGLRSSSHGVNPLNHLCQAMAIGSHSSPSLVRSPNVWQSQGEAGVSAGDSGCYAGVTSQEMAAPCSPYNSPYPSPCPSDPVSVEDEDTLHCLSAIVADRPRLPVPRFGMTDTTAITNRHDGGPRVDLAGSGRMTCSRRKQRTPKKGGRSARHTLDVITASPYWTQKKTCCGIINLGQNREVLLMAGQYKPCSGGQHDATCSAALERLSTDNGMTSCVEEECSDMSENSSDSFEMMARDLALLNTRSASTTTPSSMASTSAASSAMGRDPANVRTPPAVWSESSPQSCRQQLGSQGPNGSHDTAEDDLEIDDYEVVDNVYHHNWDSYYDSERQHHSNMTYFKEVSQRQCPAVSVSKVDALGALDLTKETGGWGRGPPQGVN